MNLATVREAIADACATISGWNAEAYIPDQVVTPMMVVGWQAIDYDLVMARGADEYTFIVSAYVSRTADHQQALLDELADPTGVTSLKTTLETQSVYDAAGVDYIRVRSVTAVDEKLVGALPYLFVDFECEVVG